MTNYSENELIPHALKIIKEHKDGIDMKNLLIELRDSMKPDGVDCETLKNRSDDKFSQKVRNLKSHKTLEKQNLVDCKSGKFYISQVGLNFLWDLKENIKTIGKKFNINQEGLKFINEENYDLLSINILNDWPISVRTYNALKGENIIFLGDLITYTESNNSFASLLRIKNFGRKSLNEISELYRKITTDINITNFNPSKWENLREKLILDQKKNLIDKIESQKGLKGFNKSLFKNFEEFKEFFYKIEKIIINPNIEASKLEKLILVDIDYIQSLFTDRTVDFFKGRYGYKEEYKTLDQLGKKYEITRERVRQLERDLNSTLVRLGKIDKDSLVRFFEKYEYVSFHKLFPTLDKNFTDTARSTGEITRDKLVIFMENFCGVKEEYFKTPERELWHFDVYKLQEIFTLIPSGLNQENFIEIIKDNFGYNNFVAKSAIEFMDKKELIKIQNNKIYPIKISKNLEVTNILVSYPEGLHWRKIAEIGNRSFTKNKWDLNRIVGDSSLNMLSNQNIYLVERGTYKLFKFCPEIKNKDMIIEIFIRYLKNNNLEQSPMEPIFKEIRNLSDFKNLNFYDARAIIKKFGTEKGLFHKGTSGTNTISLNENIKVISLKDKIRDVIFNSSGEVHLQDIIKKLQKTNEDIPVDIHLNDLVDEMKIFRISPGTFLNFEDGIKLCDKDDVKSVLNEVLDNYEFITTGFIREFVNDRLGFNLSNFYYDTLARLLAKENNWYYGANYLSKNRKKTIGGKKYIIENYDENLSTTENFQILSKKIGISKMYYNNIVYQYKNNFNTDWIHKDD